MKSGSTKHKHLSKQAGKNVIPRGLEWENPLEYIMRVLTPKHKPTPKANVTPFVKRMRELSDRAKPRLIWDSSNGNTYRRK